MLYRAPGGSLSDYRHVVGGADALQKKEPLKRTTMWGTIKVTIIAPAYSPN